jgi:hypothetical protein
MWSLVVGVGFLFVLALLLVQFKPAAVGEAFAQPRMGSGLSLNSPMGYEGFTVVAVDPVRSPACTARSPDAQSLLARFATVPESDPDAAELRLLVSKLCCMEADISSPAAGMIRTLQANQFRTSSDMDMASNIVARCRSHAVTARDVDLILDKFSARGHELIGRLCVGADQSAGAAELDKVLSRLRWAMTSFCVVPAPTMDRPSGPRDMGFWEPESADLRQYEGVSAEPK